MSLESKVSQQPGKFNCKRNCIKKQMTFQKLPVRYVSWKAQGYRGNKLSISHMNFKTLCNMYAYTQHV
jgi:hypothetical protein